MAKRAIVAIFDTQNQAYDAARAIYLLPDDVVHVDGGAMITKDAMGNVSVPETKDLGGAWGTAGGALVGALIGLLAGPAGAAAGLLLGGAFGAVADVTNLGINQDYVDLVGSQLVPGKTALAAEIEEGSTAPVDRIIAQHGGHLYRTDVMA